MLPHRNKFRKTRLGCWLWHGAKNQKGYGVCRWAGRLRKAHAVLYEYVTGKILLPGVELDHTCRNRCCVNPAHLEEVTHQENMARMWANRRKQNDWSRSAMPQDETRSANKALGKTSRSNEVRLAQSDDLSSEASGQKDTGKLTWNFQPNSTKAFYPVGSNP